ncbi:hypothetical protein L1987_50050 [Smallanthus sonchifolius]|uniref:Uncharacterized protein n=1 Tax=Smallanthus sonchifolius TaxID=185202 RepID=A0ACB9FXF1_9ASTR|nr:hypothetical protein L1987_50050 [Smallanthus sonchifolius]
MVADLVHGLGSRKLWFPCKYFRINSAFLTVISVAMKLPVDLTSSMPGTVDQVAKLGSMAFMCAMMANLLPCLATMDDNALLSNIAALCVLVITLVVNVCIQIQTGVVSILTYNKDPRVTEALASPRLNVTSLPISIENYTILHIIYVTLLLVSLIVYVCSSLALVKSRKIIESKYLLGHVITSNDNRQSSGELLTVEKLQTHIIGVVIGTILPPSRCFAIFSLGEETKNLEQNEELLRYVLQLNNEMKLFEEILEGILKYVDQLIQKGEKNQLNNLTKIILEKSTRGFLGVQRFDHVHGHVPPLSSKGIWYQDCWSLPVVTLTTIAFSLPKIEKSEVERLLKSVTEGLVYVTLVEVSLNVTYDSVGIQKEAETLWREKLQDLSSQEKTAGQIVEWFRDTAKNIFDREDRSKDNTAEGKNDDLIICADSMYRVTKTILLTYSANIDAMIS